MVAKTPSKFTINRLFPCFAIASIVLTIATSFSADVTSFVQIAFSCGLILIIGLPHGALDVIMINRLAKSLKLRGPAFINTSVIVLCYVVIVALAWQCWRVSPMLSLTVFLVIAALHFSHDWGLCRQKILAFSLATFTIAAPVVFHSEQLAAYFVALMLSPEQADDVITLLEVALAGSSLYIGIWLLIKNRLALNWVWVITMMIVAYLLAPLWYFCVYFCAVHSILHTLKIKHANQLSWLNIGRALLLPLLGTLLLGGLAFLLLPSTQSLSNDILQVTFIGLFALTVPHMILTYIHDAILLPSPSIDSK